jgi:hypothetical protein
MIMKQATTSFRQLGIFTTCSLLALSSFAEAKGPKKGHDKDHHEDRNSHDYDRDRQTYTSHPRSSFTLTLGTGYAGRGYYYGPPHASYYYQSPGVTYYNTREQAPREYYTSYNSSNSSVQRALARRGYYQGSIDGAIGPQSRRAIANYQHDQGLQETGSINSSLLNSLGL